MTPPIMPPAAYLENTRSLPKAGHKKVEATAVQEEISVHGVVLDHCSEKRKGRLQQRRPRLPIALKEHVPMKDCHENAGWQAEKKEKIKGGRGEVYKRGFLGSNGRS